jgi:radical SAM superfamily enzyme YgiQ (UPF0313 family)
MKVHLVFSPSAVSTGMESLGENLWPPMGVLYLAGYLRSRLPEVEIRVTDGCRIGFSRTLRDILEYRPDVLGISFYTTQAMGAGRLSRRVKSALPGALVVMGGPHATALPLETLRDSGADLCVVGEGEETFRRIVETAARGAGPASFRDLRGVWSLSRDASGEEVVYRNDPAPFIAPLDAIPLPARDLLRLGDYRGWFISRQVPQTTMLFARGCPFRCTFCANGIWRTSLPLLRPRSPGGIVDEMEHLSRAYGIREVYDQADEFNHSLPHALEVCSEMARRGLGMSWQASVRARPFSDELARLMAEAGCWCVSLGVESANESALRGIRKQISLPDVEAACRALRRHGIKVRAHFMLYNVWEENGELRFEDGRMSENTLAYAERLFREGLIQFITWSVTTPFPGSELYDIALRHSLIREDCRGNWDSWGQDELFVMDLPGVSREERMRLKKKGEWLRIQCMLRNRDFKWKDVPFMLKRGVSTFLKILAP